MKRSKKWWVVVWALVIAVFVVPLSGGAQQSAFPTPQELQRTNVCLKMATFYFPGGVENGQVTGEGTKIVQGTLLGSGFIVKSDGTIVTNCHVALRALAGLAIFANGSHYDIVHIKVYDPVNDLAVLKIQAQQQFPAVTLGNSDTVQPMNEVIAVGNPEGMGLNITRGQVSQVVRDDHGKPALIRHTAQIAPGSSGGSLYKGQSVIGVNASVRLYQDYGTPTGFNDAIPINKVKPLLQPQYSQLKLLQNIFNPDLNYLLQNEKISELLNRNGQVDRASGRTPGVSRIVTVDLDSLEDYVFVLEVPTGQKLQLVIVNGQGQVIGCGNDGVILLSNEYRQEGVIIGVFNYDSRAVNFGLHIDKIIW
jgi:S1-C subfamily serine protease